MDEPTIRDVHETVTRCIDKLEKVNKDVTDIKIGLYGPLSAPGTGFINETKTHIKSLDGKLAVLLDERKERKADKKWTMRTAFGAVIGALIALVKSFFFSGQATTP